MGVKIIKKKHTILISILIFIVSSFSMLFLLFFTKENPDLNTSVAKVATQKDSEDIDEMMNQITSSNFEEELKIELKNYGYNAQLAGYSIYSFENKSVLFQINNTKEKDEKMKAEIKKLVNNISKANGLGSFKIELSYKKD